MNKSLHVLLLALRDREALIGRLSRYIPTEANENGCLEWKGCKDRKGYATISLGKNGCYCNVRVSRVIAALYMNLLDDPSLHVLHKCDNRPCVNAKHLFLGTNEDNMADRDRKGRNRIMFGERNGSATLNTALVVSIRERWSRHIKGDVMRMALEYGVCHQTISSIGMGKTWKHLNGGQMDA